MLAGIFFVLVVVNSSSLFNRLLLTCRQALDLSNPPRSFIVYERKVRPLLNGV